MTNSDIATVEPEAEYPLPAPIVTYCLLAAIAALFIAMAVASKGTIKGFSEAVVDIFGAKVNSRILEKGHLVQWWRLVTPIFLHGGILHVIVNSYSLYILGRQIEPFYGSRKYFLIFIVSGIAGVAASLKFSISPSLGASGAIFGLVGAGIVFPLRFRSLIPAENRRQIVLQLVQVAVINLGIGFMARGIVDNYAHIGGLLGGGVAALFLLPDALLTQELSRHKNVALWLNSGAMLAFILVCAAKQGVWALSPWWRLDVPVGYRPLGKIERFQGEWRSPGGSTIVMADTQHNPNLYPFAVSMLMRQDLPAKWIKIGKNVAKLVLIQSETRVVETCLLVAPGDGSKQNKISRLILIQLRTTNTAFVKEQPGFAKAITGFRILHASPPDLYPVPLTVPKEATQAPKK